MALFTDFIIDLLTITTIACARPAFLGGKIGLSGQEQNYVDIFSGPFRLRLGRCSWDRKSWRVTWSDHRGWTANQMVWQWLDIFPGSWAADLPPRQGMWNHLESALCAGQWRNRFRSGWANWREREDVPVQSLATLPEVVRQSGSPYRMIRCPWSKTLYRPRHMARGS